MTAAVLRERAHPSTRIEAAVLALAGPLASVGTQSGSAWASITFSGWRHKIELRFTGAAAIAAGERFIEALPEHEFNIRGVLVADSMIGEVRHHYAIDPPFVEVTAELLVLDED